MLIKKNYNTCECSDPGCVCGGRCAGRGTVILYRVDMQDETGTLFCENCASDALDSGLFTEEDPTTEEWND